MDTPLEALLAEMRVHLDRKCRDKHAYKTSILEVWEDVPSLHQANTNKIDYFVANFFTFLGR